MLTSAASEHGHTTGNDPPGPTTPSRWRPVLRCCSVAVPAAGLIVTAEVTGRAGDPTSAAWRTGTAGAVAVLLVWLGTAIWFTVGRERSSHRPVFRSRRTFGQSVGLVVVAGAMCLALVFGDPFGHLVRNVRLGGGDLADLGLLAAIVMLLVAAGAALVDGADHRRAERRWPEHMPR